MAHGHVDGGIEGVEDVSVPTEVLPAEVSTTVVNCHPDYDPARAIDPTGEFLPLQLKIALMGTLSGQAVDVGAKVMASDEMPKDVSQAVSESIDRWVLTCEFGGNGE